MTLVPVGGAPSPIFQRQRFKTKCSIEKPEASKPRASAAPQAGGHAVVQSRGTNRHSVGNIYQFPDLSAFHKESFSLKVFAENASLSTDSPSSRSQVI